MCGLTGHVIARWLGRQMGELRPQLNLYCGLQDTWEGRKEARMLVSSNCIFAKQEVKMFQSSIFGCCEAFIPYTSPVPDSSPVFVMTEPWKRG